MTTIASIAPMITTFTGRFINLAAFTEDDVDVRDVAHHLACMNRFVGAAPQPLNVALHSVYVSRLAVAKALQLTVGAGMSAGPSPARLQALGLQGLVHDGSEAFLGEITKWLKRHESFAAYRALEEQIQSTIYRRFGCDTTMDKLVKWADTLMCRVEGWWAFGADWPGARYAPNKYGPLTADEQALVGAWAPLDWATSERAFLDRYTEVTA